MDESADNFESGAAPAHVIAQVDSLNEQGRKVSNTDTRLGLDLLARARRLAEACSYRLGVARSLSHSSYCHYKAGDYHAGLADARAAVSLFERDGDRRGLAGAFYCLGSNLFALGELSKAIEAHLKSLELWEALGERAMVAGLFTDIGAIYADLSDYPKALEYFQRSLRLKTEVGDIERLSGTLANLGVIHERLGEYQAAADYYVEAARRSKETGNVEHEGVSLLNLANIYSLMDRDADALDYLLKAVEFSRRYASRYPEAAALVYLGRFHRRMAEPEKALAAYREGLAIARQINRRVLESEALIELGELLCEQGQYAPAAESISDALGIARGIGNNELTFRAHGALSRVYERQGDYARALEHYKSLHEFRQKVFGEEAEKNVRRVLIQAEVEKAQKEAEIHRLRHVELAARVEELEEALAQIRQLQGLLPICSYCKSIRDDENYWQSVEGYISQHAGVQFSHGVCPRCYEKFMLPQLEEARRRQKSESPD
jgi:tetratricopeptide (TPR) repeat protein